MQYEAMNSANQTRQNFMSALGGDSVEQIRNIVIAIVVLMVFFLLYRHFFDNSSGQSKGFLDSSFYDTS